MRNWERIKLIMLNLYFSKILTDVNECDDQLHQCDIDAECHNTDGSYTCQCTNGYHGDGYVCTGKYIFLMIRLSNSA